MRSISIIFCLVLILFCFSHTQAKIIHVPGDSSTIQGGINGAVNGDTVLVAPDTYYEHINFNGKSILVISEAGAENTIIDKFYDNLSIVNFNSGEDTNSVLDGFTVRNATGKSGIECWSASPLITNNIISDNTGAALGGGILCEGSSPTIRDNVISSNFSTNGGGICAHNYSHPVIVNNEVTSNEVSLTGGGIYCFTHCNATITGNIITSNTYSDGGGILCDELCNGTISFNLVRDNAATGRGGGIFCYSGSSPLLLNNTITSNQGQASEAGGIVCQASCSPAIVNCIISSNLAGYGICCSDNSSPSISYSDVWNNVDGDYYGCDPGEGCISADPWFCDPENSDYYLHSLSPCLGTGEGGADMGAFGIGCGGVDVTPGSDQDDTATTTVSVKFYIENFQGHTDTFDVNVTDSLGWSIDPLYYEVPLGPGQLDSVSFAVSIPLVPIGTTDRIFALAISQTHPNIRDSASLNVTCNAFMEDWDIIPGNGISGLSNSLVTAVFYIQNTGLALDSCYLTILDSLGWDIQPADYWLTLNPGEQDSVFFDIQIPSIPLGITNKMTLAAVSLTNPYVGDSASLFVACESYNITITEISDVGNDQGKQVNIDWTSFPDSDPLVTDFSVFRRKDSLLTTPFAKLTSSPDSPLAYPPGEWQWLVTIPAFGETLYSVVIPTLKDSTIAEGIHWSVFFIRAGTGNPTVYFDSPIDSGYSLDNLSPSPPTGLFASHEPAVTKLTWSATIASDFDYYTLYRDTLSGFSPDLSNRLGFTIDTTFTDSVAQLGRIYYYLTCATDFSGNQSAPSNEAAGVRYIAGDANVDGEIEIGDVVVIISYLFRYGPAPDPMEAGDATCDGDITVDDVVYLISYLFRNGPPPDC